MSSVLVKHQFQAMGGPCEVHLWLPTNDYSNITSELEAEVERLEEKYSRYRESSLLSRINRGELNSTPLDDETAALLNYADQCYQLSDCLFDPTVGILKNVWNYRGTALPEPYDLQNCLKHVGWRKLGWDGSTLNIPDGMELDFGGIVKEFATDRLTVILKEKGIAGLVNLAGDIAVSSTQPDGEPWDVAISHPREQGAIAVVKLSSGGIAGSGDYERYIDVDGIRYCHILRPDTGYPSTGGLSSISVIANSCLMAGSVSTVAMLKGQDASDWLDEMGLPYLAIDQSLNIFGSIEVEVT